MHMFSGMLWLSNYCHWRDEEYHLKFLEQMVPLVHHCILKRICRPSLVVGVITNAAQRQSAYEMIFKNLRISLPRQTVLLEAVGSVEYQLPESHVQSSDLMCTDSIVLTEPWTTIYC
ncbi:hypothetical protein M514_13743 [Trichuris suis]|uniref:Uncharacterized protein n=1 Tax=Trichuris suis TaxID=68888 RepID=A0A085LK85_9BILA|nr:hypothetical protein M513_13743 [Trichuris suis]KFD70439.1 hypothetical protein M514_13743 [Trichuris suis]KHJ47945.1 hypothetical protein D918_02104 [Trichuris suis]